MFIPEPAGPLSPSGDMLSGRYGRELLFKNQETVETSGSLGSQGLRTNKLLMKDKYGQEIAWYWFTAGNKVTENYYLQQCYFTWNELSVIPPAAGA